VDSLPLSNLLFNENWFFPHPKKINQSTLSPSFRYLGEVLNKRIKVTRSEPSRREGGLHLAKCTLGDFPVAGEWNRNEEEEKEK